MMVRGGTGHLFIEKDLKGHIAFEDTINLIGAVIEEHMVEVLVFKDIARIAQPVDYTIKPS